MTTIPAPSDASGAEPSSPPCALHEVDPAYAGLDAETLARARWRARRALRRGCALGGAARGRRTVRLARASETAVAPSTIAFAPRR